MAALAVLCAFSSCSESSERVVNPHDSVASLTDRPVAQKYPDALLQMRSLLDAVADSTWCSDGDGFIDIERFERLAAEKTGYRIEEIRKIETTDLLYQRELMMRLSEPQSKCLGSIRTYFAGRRTFTDGDIAYIDNLCEGLSQHDAEEIKAGVMLALLTIEIASDPDFLQEHGYMSAAGFLCNLSTLGIGAVWELMGTHVLIYAGVAAGPAGFISAAVTGIGVILIADIACPKIFQKRNK